MTKKKDTEYFIPANKTMIINFDKIFGNPKYKDYNTFRVYVARKRVFAGETGEIICKGNNEILAMDNKVTNEFLYNYFCIKKALDDGKFFMSEKDRNSNGLIDYFAKNQTVDAFISGMISYLFTENFVNVVRKYVEISYSEHNIQVDGNLNFKKYDPATTFNDEQFKVIYVTSFLSRFAIPLCMHYAYINYEKNVNINGFIVRVFNSLMKVAESGTNVVDLRAKLYLFITRAIRGTQHSDGKRWEKIVYKNITKEYVNTDLTNKVIVSIIPRLKTGVKIINYIKVVVRESVEKYILGARDDFDIFTIQESTSANATDEDNLNESDIFDIFYTKSDKTITILNKFANEDAVRTIMMNNNVFLTNEERMFYLNTIQFNVFQLFAVIQVFSRFFGGPENVKSCTRDEYVMLVVTLIKKMEQLGLNVLKHFITGIRVGYSHTRGSAKILSKSLAEDPVYNDILENKYRFAKEVFNTKKAGKEDKNPIKENLITIINNNYVYNFFGYEDNGKPIEVDYEILKNELLRFYQLLIM